MSTASLPQTGGSFISGECIQAAKSQSISGVTFLVYSRRGKSACPARSSSRTLLESTSALTLEDFRDRARRISQADARAFQLAREETMSLTEEIEKVEQEIDEMVAGLYGVDVS